RQLRHARAEQATIVIAVQPNVPVSFERSLEETAVLVARHITLSTDALREWDETQTHNKKEASAQGVDPQLVRARADTPRVVIWPESPMNFTYTQDAEFREL